MKGSKIKRLDWNQAQKEIKKINKKLWESIQLHSKEISTPPYLYEIILPLGADIINQGCSQIFNSEFKEDIELKGDFSFQEFLDDFKYSDKQPLTLLLEGVVEVYDKNSIKYGTKETMWYTYPIKIFRKGDIFGTYETMDYLTKQQEIDYNYSASSGHKSIYPLLPNPTGGTKEYKNIMYSWVQEFKKKTSTETDPTILDLFPLIFKKIAPSIDYRTRLLLFPTKWYDSLKEQFNPFKLFITETAWSQIRISSENSASLFETYRTMEKDNAFSLPNPFFLAQIINYIHQIKLGLQPVLKFDCNMEYTYLHEVHEGLKTIVNDIYNPVLFYFDFLHEGEKGILPLVTPPLKTSPRVKRGGIDLFDNLIAVLNKSDRELAIELETNSLKSNTKGTKDTTQYFKSKFGDNVRSASFMTQIIIEIER